MAKWAHKLKNTSKQRNSAETALILVARRPVAPGERIGLILTEGSGLAMKQGQIPRALGKVAGIDYKALV